MTVQTSLAEFSEKGKKRSRVKRRLLHERWLSRAWTLCRLDKPQDKNPSFKNTEVIKNGREKK